MSTIQFINVAAGTTPDGTTAVKGNAPHTRSYQACLPCRSRKVKCDLGSVDSPHDPPCLRCKREQKECYFSSTRRKGKTETREDALGTGDAEAYERRNSRKRTRDNTEEQNASYEYASQFSQSEPPAVVPRPLTPGGSLGRTKPLRRPLSRASSVVTEDDPQINDDTAALLQKTELYNGHDALNLLYEAAGHTGDLARYNGAAPHIDNNISEAYGSVTTSHTEGLPGLQKVVSKSSRHNPVPLFQQPGLSQGIKVWSRMRFVRGQWFSATEAIAYVDHFYRFLCPLTPITIPDFRDPSTHAKLLREEPMLAVTILTLSSRYMELPGPSARTRAFAIHDKLWKYLQGMIDRVIWGQEHFGGGFGGVGFQLCDSDPAARPKGLRTLGTIESLLLLTEWHTRALHFPPGDDNNELLVDNDVDPALDSLSTPDNITADGISAKRVDSWLEPCWRSDRMCWSLLANAKAIAYELGVFDVPTRQPDSAYNTPAFLKRARNIRRLLFIYITQTSGRLSLPSMLPDEHCQDLFPQNPVDAANFVAPRTLSNILEESGNDAVLNATLYYWYAIAKLMKEANHDLFQNRKFTRDVIASGEYVDRLETLRAKVRKWKEEFDKCNLITQHMRYVLNIEYHYTRIYMNTVALQAIVDRCTQNPRNDGPNTPAQQEPGQTRIVPPQTLATWLEGDRRFIKDIVSESQSLLRIVVEGLLPQEYLKYAPVRTYFRIVTVSIFLLKTFAIGASEADFNLSLGLLGRATYALSTCIVDDVHLGNRHAELLSTLTNRVKARIIRIGTKHGKSTTNGKVRRSSSSAAARAPHSNRRQDALSTDMYSYDQRPNQDPWRSSAQKQNDNAALYPWNNGTTATPPSFGKHWSPSTDPMQGISLSPFDFDFRNPSSSIMPPPTFSFDTGLTGGEFGLAPGGGNDSPTNSFGRHSSSQQSDWFALPLDPLINFNHGDVRNIGYGSDLSGKDMLEVLLGEPSSYDLAGYGEGGVGSMYLPLSGRG